MKYKQNQHFSHHHVLITLTLDEGDQINCDACEQDITDHQPFHGCIKCKYYLHKNCLNTPRSLDHPSHPTHPLTLHQTPTYSSRSFTCNACDSVGNGFSLSCAQCEFDIHLHCANLPSYVISDKHPHQLKLMFGSPYSDVNTAFACDICCAEMDPHQWLYYCAGCDFGSHLDCVNAKPRPKGKKREKGEGAGSGEEQQGRYYSPSVEDIEAIRLNEEALAAAHMESMIAARSRQNILDSLDPPRRYRYDYY